MSNPLDEIRKKLDQLGLKVNEEMKTDKKKVKIQGEFVEKQVELFSQVRGLLEQELVELQSELCRLDDLKNKYEKKGGSDES